MSLLMRMMQEPFFREKQILIIDQSNKTTNDRTWCFWETEAGIFESIVQHQWAKANFYSNGFSATLALFPYQYKMIRGIDLYSLVKQEAAKRTNIEWRQEKVVAIDGEKATVILETEIVSAKWIFNSILFDKNPLTTPGAKGYYLLQHFKGWMIETEEDSFDPSIATYMDFRVSQDAGTTFMYVLPVTKTKALIEYTLFTEKLLAPEQYENALKEYISSTLKINTYKIEHEEAGVIPMTNRRFPHQQGRAVYMGIAGGQAKGSSGYAFQFIQKRTAAIIAGLVAGTNRFNRQSFNDKKFHLYDSVLLNVLHHRKMNGDQIFAAIFQKNPPERVLRFLDNETTVWEDLQIMQSVPAGIFLPSALQEMIS
jgi:lycopene beta-cyclase